MVGRTVTVKKKRLLFVVNVDWFFVSHRLPIALAALAQGYDVHVATTMTSHHDQLVALGLVVHPLRIERTGTSLWHELSLFLALAKIMAAVRPDIAHLVTIKPVLFGSLIARWQGIPGVVAAVSGLGFIFTDTGFKAGIARLIMQSWYRVVLSNSRLKAVFQNSDDCAALMGMAAQHPNKCILIRGSGVDLSAYTAEAFPSTPPTFLMAARLLTDKGVIEFVTAAQQLKNEGVVARFCLVGSTDPDSRSSIPESLLHVWRQVADVEIWGYRKDMPAVLSLAHVVVLPSYREGLPRVLLEAAACGRAVITTDVPGCRDAIAPGVSGLLVPVRDSAALAAAMRWMVENPMKREAMGHAARRLAEREFSIEKVVQTHLQIYQDLVDAQA